MDEQFEQLAKDVTVGLQDDPELRLDVHAEVVSHLEDTAAQFMSEENSTEESTILALKTFGSPLDLADKFLTANKQRMRLRALLRLGIRVLLIPAAFLIAIWIGYGGLARIQRLYIGFSSGVDAMTSTAYTLSDANYKPPTMLPALPSFKSARALDAERIRKQAMAQLRGSTANAPRLRANWEAHQSDPDAVAYYAYYANFLIPKIDTFSYEKGRITPDPSTIKRDIAFEQAMRRGERIEPDNALYHYRLAAYYLQAGILASAEQPRKIPATAEPDRLLNQHMMELGIAEFRKGLAKPYLRYYSAEMVKKRLSLLPPPRSTEDYIQRITIRTLELYPYLAQERSIARKIPGCARLLIAQGRVHEAEPLLQAWRVFAAQSLRTPHESLYHLLSMSSAVRVMSNESADIYQHLGRQAEAQRTREDDQRFAIPVKSLKPSSDESGVRKAQEKMLLEQGSAISSILSPIGLELVTTVDEMAPTRNHERTILNELQMSIILVLLTLAMLWTAFRGIITLRGLRGGKAVPLLLLPQRKTLITLIGVGILLPLALYWCYTQIPGISGRFYGLDHPIKVVIESAVMTVLLLWLPAMLAGWYIRRRCNMLGIPVPSPWQERRWKLAGILALVGWLICIGFGLLLIEPLGYDLPAFIILLACIILPLIPLALMMRKILRASRPYLLFFTTVSRSLVPVYALAIILIAVIVHPYLRSQEEKWLARDGLFMVHSASEGVLPVEGRLIKKLQSDMRHAIEEMHVHRTAPPP